MLKRSVLTILITQRLQKLNKDKKKKRKRGVKINFQPTYRMEPVIQFQSMRVTIVNKIKQTFESLIDKHKQYDVEYTPRLLRILTEMIKNDSKSFKLERYKVITHITILQKVLSQSIQFISRMLANKNDDGLICLKTETRTFYAVCLVCFVYNE